MTDVHSACEEGERPVQITLTEVQQTGAPRGKHEAPGVNNCLGNLQPFVSESLARSEQAQLGMTLGKPGTGVHGGQHRLTKTLAAPRPIEGCHGLPEAVDGPTIVALVQVS